MTKLKININAINNFYFGSVMGVSISWRNKMNSVSNFSLKSKQGRSYQVVDKIFSNLQNKGHIDQSKTRLYSGTFFNRMFLVLMVPN